MKKYVYHGSPKGDIKQLQPKKSTHLKDYVYATEEPVIALIFAVDNHGDLDFDLSIVDNKVIFTERREGAFDKYNQPGYLYKLDGTNFKHLDSLWEGEVISDKEEDILSCEHIENLYKKIEEYGEKGEIVIYRYPDRPKFIPKDDSDLVDKYINYEKVGHKGAIDNMLALFPSLKEQVFAKLETPNEFFYIGKEGSPTKDIIVYDNIMDAIENADKSIFIREDGWIKYNVIDSKFNFEKGGFNFDEVFNIYKLTGNSTRLTAHCFRLNDVQIKSCENIDFNQYLPNSSIKKTGALKK